MDDRIPLAELRVLLTKLRQLYTNMDARIAKRIARDQRKPSCQKGCDNCCKIMTVVTIAEALLIAHELKLKPDWRELIPRLRESALQMAPIGLSEYDYAQKRLPCIFLRDGACSVYSIRPGACRFYLVVSPAVLCDASNTQTVASIDTIEEKAAVMGLNDRVFGPEGMAVAPLPLMILQAMRMISQKPAEQALLDAALLGLPDPLDWCMAKIQEAQEHDPNDPIAQRVDEVMRAARGNP